MKRVRSIYLFAVLGAFGGLVAAALHQGLFLPLRAQADAWWQDVLLGLLIGAPIGFFPRLPEAWGRYSLRPALRSALAAAAMAAVGGMVAVPAGEALHRELEGGYAGRALSLGLLGLTLGAGEALLGGARRWRGLAGGWLGGMLAGVLLEYLVRLLHPHPDSAIVALVLLGGSVSLSVALLVHVASEAWLEGLHGSKVYLHVYPLSRFRGAGKAVVGSDPKVFLWLPDALPRQAGLTVTPRGTRLEHLAEAGETLINDVPVRERILRDGDVIRIGHSRLRYRERHSHAAGEGS